MENDIIIAAQLFLEPGREFVLHLLGPDDEIVSSHKAVSCGIVEGLNPYPTIIVKVDDDELLTCMGMEIDEEHVLVFMGIDSEDAVLNYNYRGTQPLSNVWTDNIFKVELKETK